MELDQTPIQPGDPRIPDETTGFVARTTDIADESLRLALGIQAVSTAKQSITDRTQSQAAENSLIAVRVPAGNKVHCCPFYAL